MTNPTKTDRKVTIGSYIALAFAIVFFSGLMQSMNGMECSILQRSTVHSVRSLTM